PAFKFGYGGFPVLVRGVLVPLALSNGVDTSLQRISNCGPGFCRLGNRLNCRVPQLRRYDEGACRWALLKDARLRGVERPVVAGGGLDLRGLEGDVSAALVFRVACLDGFLKRGAVVTLRLQETHEARTQLTVKQLPRLLRGHLQQPHISLGMLIQRVGKIELEIPGNLCWILAALVHGLHHASELLARLD